MPSPVAARAAVAAARWARSSTEKRTAIACALFSFSKMFSVQDRARLLQANNIWLATVRPNQTPHLAPIWFVWHDEKAYICTGRHSVKARNIAANPHVSLALEDGNDPVVVQAKAKILDRAPSRVIELFQQKYQWDITNDSTYDAVIEITPQRVVL